MIKRLTHNWHWKLLSLFISFLFWVMIVNYDDPAVRKVFEDVKVEKINEQVITSQNLAIEYVDGETVDIVLRGKRSIMSDLRVEDISVTADLSLVSVTNAVDIVITPSDNVEVIESTPNKLVISTEQIRSELKSVQVYYKGNLEDDYIRLKAVVTPNQIEITGPESRLARVSSVIVPTDVDGANTDVTLLVAPQVIDSDGNIIKGIEVSNTQIQIKVPIQKIKTIPIVVQSYGEVPEDLRLISIGPEAKTATVRGEDDAVNAISRLTINDIDRASFTEETTSIEVNLSDYLPEGIYLYDMATSNMVNVELEAVVSKDYVFEDVDVNVKQIPEGLQFKFLSDTRYSVSIEGIEEELDGLTKEILSPRIHLSGLEAGVHQVPLEVMIPQGFEMVSEQPMVSVELSKEVEVTTNRATPQTTTSN